MIAAQSRRFPGFVRKAGIPDQRAIGEDPEIVFGFGPNLVAAPSRLAVNAIWRAASEIGRGRFLTEFDDAAPNRARARE